MGWPRLFVPDPFDPSGNRLARANEERARERGRWAPFWIKASARRARTELAANDGFTLNVRKAGMIPQVDSWGVSMFGFEERFRGLPSQEQIEAYIRGHQDLLFRPGKCIYLRGWFDPDTREWCLDLTRLYPDVTAELWVARVQRRKAICNLGNGQCLWLDEAQRRAA